MKVLVPFVLVFLMAFVPSCLGMFPKYSAQLFEPCSNVTFP